ncbi:MAG: MaoC family dehydratase [Lachnospiraceae bacterium]|nr:MaoC family dehydratase [Lachnospiraceae bacterium]
MKHYYQDFSVGQSYQKDFFISEELGQSFAQISGDFNPVHLDEEYARETMFGKRIAHGMLLGSYISGVLGSDFPGEGTIYLKQDMKFTKPVYYGDTITISVTILEMDDARNRMTLETNCYNQESELVLAGTALVMLRN